MSFKDTNNDGGVGDRNGLTQKLDYIASLGVNTLWVNPVTLSNHGDNGYDVIDYKRIDPFFVTEEDSKWPRSCIYNEAYRSYTMVKK